MAKTPHQARQRAAIVLLAARGAPMPGNPRRRGYMWTRCRCAPGGAGWPPAACPALADRKRVRPVVGRSIAGSSRRRTKATWARPSSRSSSARSSRQRLHGPQRGSGSAPGVRRPSQRHGTAFPSEVHHLRPDELLARLDVASASASADSATAPRASPAPVPRQPSGRGLALPGGGRVPGSSRVIASEMLGPSAGGYPTIPWELARA